MNISAKKLAALLTALVLGSTAFTACGGSEKPKDPDHNKTSSEKPSDAPKPSDEPSQSETPSSEPSPSDAPTKSGTKAGETLVSEGFSFTIPKGFEAVTPPPPPAKAGLRLEGGNASLNFNFIPTPVGSAKLKTLMPQMKQALSPNVSNLTEVPPFKVAGAEETGGFKGTYKNVNYPITQLYLLKDGKVYIVTMVAADPAKAKQGEPALKSILDTWKFS